jgi:hypothetical protein
MKYYYIVFEARDESGFWVKDARIIEMEYFDYELMKLFCIKDVKKKNKETKENLHLLIFNWMELNKRQYETFGKKHEKELLKIRDDLK